MFFLLCVFVFREGYSDDIWSVLILKQRLYCNKNVMPFDNIKIDARWKITHSSKTRSSLSTIDMFQDELVC